MKRLMRPLVLLPLLGALLLSGCAPAVIPSEPPGIEGSVTRVSRPVDGESDILVEVPQGTRPAPGFVSDKASVRVTPETRILAADGSTAQAAEVLTVGSTVRVWFAGAVAESYPVQGTAAVIQSLR